MKEVLTGVLPIIISGLLGVLTTIISMAALFMGTINSRKTNYNSNITAYRLKWIESFRDYMSNFCAYNKLIINHDNEKFAIDYIKNMTIYYYKIHLHLYRGFIVDKSIVHKSSIREKEIQVLALLEKVFNNKEELLREELLNGLVDTSQDLVREQWIIVYNESSGPSNDRK